MTIKHHPNCTASYPEKPKDEMPQQIYRQTVDGFTIDTCVDCGAFITDLPHEGDPYWDGVEQVQK